MIVTRFNQNAINFLKGYALKKRPCGTYRFVKIRIRYKGDELAIINNINTNRDNLGDYKNSAMYSKTRNIISSNTKVSVFDASLKLDKINVVYDSIPRMVTSSNIKIYDTNVDVNMDNINILYDSVPNISTVISNKLFDANNNITLDKLNALNGDTTAIITLNDISIMTDIDLDSGSSLLNKDNSSILNPAIQLNPGVILE